MAGRRQGDDCRDTQAGEAQPARFELEIADLQTTEFSRPRLRVRAVSPSRGRRKQAREFIVANRQPLITAVPVIVETCFFLDTDAKGRLLEWVQRGALTVADVPVSAYAKINIILRKYANRKIDFADAALVWLANQTGNRGILTVDESDFALFRLQGGKRFELLRW